MFSTEGAARCVALCALTMLPVWAFGADGPVADASDPLPGWLASLENKAKNIWQNGQKQYVVPLYAYHDRFTYTSESVEKLNEWTLGWGYGKSLKSDDGQVESLYFMGHLDSNRNLELNLGYSWQQFHEYAGVHYGLGFAAGVVSRKDLLHRSPVPFVLPQFSFVYDEHNTLGFVFIPKLNGGVNHGNVLFMYLNHDIQD